MKTANEITNDAYQLQQDLCGFHVGDIVVPLAVPVQGRFGWTSKQFIDDVFAKMVGRPCTIADFHPDGVRLVWKAWQRKFPFYLLVPMGEGYVDWKEKISKEIPAPCFVANMQINTPTKFRWIVDYNGETFEDTDGVPWKVAQLAPISILQTALETYYTK